MKHDSAAHETSQTNQADLAEGYRQMAADIEHEMEAEEWAEALIGDVALDEE
jgi:putative NADPH-quinone reductase